MLLTPSALKADPDGYWRLAENMARHGTLGRGDVPSAFRPPVYPLLLTPCAMLQAGDLNKVAVGILHVVMGVATVWLVFELALRVGLNRWSAMAALLVAFDPILLRQSTLIMTETAATLLATASLFAVAVLLERPTVVRAAWVGFLFAAAALCRPVFLPWMVLSLVLLGVILWRRSQAERAEATAGNGASRTCPASMLIFLTATVAAATVLTPWVVRNQIQFKLPIVTTTHGGYTLYLANNPQFYDYLRTARWGSVWDARELGPRWQRSPDELTPRVELADDREAYAAARATIADQPGMFAYACIVRVGRLWAVTPHQVCGGRLAAVWYWLEFLLAALGCWAIYRRKIVASPVWPWAILLVAIVTAVHAVYWTNMRMRAPLEPVIALAATAGIASLTRIKSSGLPTSFTP